MFDKRTIRVTGKGQISLTPDMTRVEDTVAVVWEIE